LIKNQVILQNVIQVAIALLLAGDNKFFNDVTQLIEFIFKVSLTRRLFESGSRPRRRVTFFCFASATAPALLYLLHPCSRKESNQRKDDPIAALILRSSLSPGVDERGSCPFVNVRHPCRTPSGLSPVKAPVLGAAYGIGFLPLASFYYHLPFGLCAVLYAPETVKVFSLKD